MKKSPVVERVEKLLRLASPNSGTTEHERASAALEVVKLIESNDLIVRERKAEPRQMRERARREEPSRTWSAAHPVQQQSRPQYTQPAPKPPGDWVQSVAMTNSLCADEDCNEPIVAGEYVWVRLRGFQTVYLHFNGPCGW